MRRFIICSALLTSAAHADSLELHPGSRFEVAQRLSNEKHDALVMRNVGIALTVVGVIGTVAGTVMLVNNATVCVDSGCGGGNASLASGGAVLVVLGQVSALAGIPTWAVGGSRAGKADKALISAGPTGAMVRF